MLVTEGVHNYLYPVMRIFSNRYRLACEQGVYDLNIEQILYVKDEYGSGVGFRGWNLSMRMNWIFFKSVVCFSEKLFWTKVNVFFSRPRDMAAISPISAGIVGC